MLGFTVCRGTCCEAMLLWVRGENNQFIIRHIVRQTFLQQKKMMISKFCFDKGLSCVVKYLSHIWHDDGNTWNNWRSSSLPSSLSSRADPAYTQFSDKWCWFVLLVTHLKWLFFSCSLYKKNSNNDVEGVKKMVKIGC